MREAEIERLAQVTAVLGTSELGTALDALLGDLAEFDMSCIFAYRDDAAPVVIHDGYSASVSRTALQSYLRGGYLLDPYYVASVSSTAPGLWRMAELAPDEFFSSDFAGSREVHPCISDQAGTLVEEIGYVVTLPEGWGGTYSLMRNRTSSPFDPAEFDRLAALTPLISAVLSRHWSLSAPTGSLPPSDGMETALQRAFSTSLTPAQYRVVKLILRGHSSQSIAHVLHITEGTAKLHRHNAYQRLGITGQSELFRLFLDRLELG